MVNTMAPHHGWYDRARAGFGTAITTSLGPAATLVLIVDGRVGNMNDNEPPTIEEREQLERFRLHQAQFEERRMWAGYCRWMASRFGVLATADKPRKAPGS